MKTVEVFVGVDMRAGHMGLKLLAKEAGLDLDSMDPMTAAIFVSKDRLRMKAYAYNGVLSYMIAKDIKRPFDLSAIDEFPKAFSKNGTMSYEKALKERLKKIFKGHMKFEESEQV